MRECTSHLEHALDAPVQEDCAERDRKVPQVAPLPTLRAGALVAVVRGGGVVHDLVEQVEVDLLSDGLQVGGAEKSARVRGVRRGLMNE